MAQPVPSPPVPLLDHIVILVSHQVLNDLPDWLTRELTILTGGEHADGLTENKLVIFEDGSYIELIAFVDGVDPERRQENPWGRKLEGTIIDWAHTLSDVSAFSSVQERVRRAKVGVIYSDPIPGGRVRPDGTELKWAVAAPKADGSSTSPKSVERGEMPFWCLDRTPRRLRVPHEVTSNIIHPCGAIGVASITVSVAGLEQFVALKQAYNAIYDIITPATGRGEARDRTATWETEPPVSFIRDKPAVGLQLLDAGDLSDRELGPIRVALFVSRNAAHSTLKPRALAGKLGERWLEIFLVPVETGEAPPGL
jgi:Glyoxalase-like domain